jgi:hypothetical protein
MEKIYALKQHFSAIEVKLSALEQQFFALEQTFSAFGRYFLLLILLCWSKSMNNIENKAAIEIEQSSNSDIKSFRNFNHQLKIPGQWEGIPKKTGKQG